MSAWLTSLRLAWRDLRAQGRRSLFFALLVAAGVASLVGVQGAARATEAGARENARQVMQGDIQVRVTKDLTPEQQAAIAALTRDGARVTEVFDVIASAANPTADRRTNVEIRAVDPAVWPFYGGFEATGAIAAENDALVAPEVLTRLQAKVGDTVQLGDTTLRIVGTVQKEPRSFATSQIPLAPRMLISGPAHLELLPQASARVLLVRLPDSISADAARNRLTPVFPEEKAVQTYEETWKSFAEVMDYVFTFLSMVALISLLVGGLGVAMAMRVFIQQKLEHIAVLKSLGASSARIMSVFLAEAAMLGALGSLIGVVLGVGVQVVLPDLLAQIIPLPQSGVDYTAAFGGFVAGTLTAVACALLPVRAVRNVKPSALFRGATGNVRPGWKARLEGLLLGGLTLAGIIMLAVTYAKSLTLGLGFVGGLVVVALVLFLISWLLLKSLRLLPQSGRPTVRHAVRSMGAPGNQVSASVVAMGLGITLIVTVYLVQASLVGQVRQVGAGPDTPNLFVMGVPAAQRDEVRNALAENPGVVRVLDPVAIVTMELLAVDGKPAAELTLPAALAKPFKAISTDPVVPSGWEVREGAWLAPEDRTRNSLVVSSEVANQLGVRVGSTLQIRVANQETRDFTVKGTYGQAKNGVSMVNLGELTFASGLLDQHSEDYGLQAITKPGQESDVVTAMLDRFPGVMTIGMADLMDLVDDYLNKVANLLRFITAFAIIAAGVILSGSLSATRLRRRKEAALLKALGASRLTVAAASALENGLLGAVAGLAGGLLGYGALMALMLAMKMEPLSPVIPILVSAAGGAVIAILVGFASTLDVLRVRPLVVLKTE